MLWKEITSISGSITGSKEPAHLKKRTDTLWAFWNCNIPDKGIKVMVCHSCLPDKYSSVGKFPCLHLSTPLPKQTGTQMSANHKKIWKQIAEDDSPGKILSPSTSNNWITNYIRLEKNKLWDIKVSQFDICVEKENAIHSILAFTHSLCHVL